MLPFCNPSFLLVLPSITDVYFILWDAHLVPPFYIYYFILPNNNNNNNNKIGVLDRVFLIKVSLPALDKYCLFHTTSLLRNLFSTTSQTINNLKIEQNRWKGAPPPRTPTKKPTPHNWETLLLGLIHSPNITSNHKNLAQICWLLLARIKKHKDLVCEQKMWTSTLSLLVPPTLKHEMNPPCMALFKRQLKVSIARINE